MDIIRKYSKLHYHQKKKLCNYLEKENFPRRRTCLTKNILYYARISGDDETYKPKLYKEIWEITFEKRYAEKSAEKNKNDSKLSTEYCKLANKKLHTPISWSITGKYKSYNPKRSLCRYIIKQTLRSDLPVSPSK